MSASRADRLMRLVSLALGAKLHAEGKLRAIAVEELAVLAEDALSLRVELLPDAVARPRGQVCCACGLTSRAKAIDEPAELIPAGQRFAGLVRDYAVGGEQLADIAHLPVDVAGAVLLATQALRQACPAGVNFSRWVSAFLLSWESAGPS